MTVREADISSYNAKSIFLLIPAGAAAGLGATFPEGSEEAVLRVVGDEELTADGLSFDPETGRLTLRIGRNVNLYKKQA